MCVCMTKGIFRQPGKTHEHIKIHHSKPYQLHRMMTEVTRPSDHLIRFLHSASLYGSDIMTNPAAVPHQLPRAKCHRHVTSVDILCTSLCRTAQVTLRPVTMAATFDMLRSWVGWNTWIICFEKLLDSSFETSWTIMNWCIWRGRKWTYT